MAPLLEFELGPILKYFDLFHGALAFTNQRTNFTFTTNFDSVDLDLFSSQLPTIVQLPNGTVELAWNSTGAVYCYGGVKPGYWDQYPIGVISGQVFNTYMNNYLLTRNATWPYYEMFNIVSPDDDSKPYVKSRECFDFVVGSLRYLKSLGATFNATSVHRNVIYIYADAPPTVANYSDAATRTRVNEFFEVLDGQWSKVNSLVDLLYVLWEIASDQLYVQHVGDTYYEFPLAWPILWVTYVEEQF